MSFVAVVWGLVVLAVAAMGASYADNYNIFIGFMAGMGMGVRNVNPKATPNGLKISTTKMDSFGFSEGKKVNIEKIADGEVKVTQID